MDGQKILFLNCDADWYGSEKILYLTLEALSPNNECHVLLPYEGILSSRIKDVCLVSSVYNYPVMRLKHFTLKGILPFTINFLVSLFYIGRYINKNRIDVIYSNTNTVQQGAILSLLFRRKHVWHIHNMLKESSGLVHAVQKFLLKNIPGINIFGSIRISQTEKIDCSVMI